MHTNKQSKKQQVGTDDVNFADNAEPRCACIILADVSGSMDGSPIAEVNAGLQQLKAKLVEDQLACLRVELALVTFNENVTVQVDFSSPDNFNPPTLTATGGTHLGAAILKGLDILNARTAEYRAAGTTQYRPWFLLLTDAKSDDDLSEAARLVKEAESQKRLSFFGVGVLGANMDELTGLSLRPPLHLEGLNFTGLFEWLSVNLSSVAVSRPGDQVPLTAPTWATV